MDITGRVRIGAASGLVAWCAFATIEAALSTLRPIAAGYQQVVAPYYWYYAPLLLLLYIVAGAVTGGLSGLLPARSTAGSRQAAATLMLTACYIINLLLERRGQDSVEYAALVLGLLLFVLLTIAVLSSRLQWALLLGDPWIAAMLLLGVPWAVGSGSAGNALGVLLGTVLVGFISRRYLSPVHTPSSLPVRQLSVTILARVAVMIAAAALSRGIAPLPTQASNADRAANRPNVVLIVMDTVRADHLSLYGYSRDTTPNLRKFAENATVFRRASAVSNWTLPSHATLFTGLYPRTHGAINYPNENLAFELASKHTTLAETLTAAGYFSFAVVANTAFVQPGYGLAQGFSLFDVRELAPWLPRRETYYLRRLLRRAVTPFLSTLEYDRVTRPAEQITNDSLAVLDQVKDSKQPFFLFVNYMDAHDPYLPPAPFDTMFAGKNRMMTRDKYLKMMNEVIAGRRQMSPEEHAHYVSQYDGAILYEDSQIARLMARLHDLGLYDNSIIIVTSDHGEAFGEHGFMNHRQSLYGDQIHTPLLVKYAGQNTGRSEDRVVSHVDVMPTILAAASLSIPEGMHGQNMRQEPWDTGRCTFAEAYVHTNLVALRPKHPARQTAVFRKGLKLIASSSGKNELYDLSSDAAEEHDIFSQAGSPAQELHAQLESWLENLPLQVKPRKQVDNRSLERLKALGYVQ